MGCRVLGIVRWSYSSRVIRFGFVGWGGFTSLGALREWSAGKVVCVGGMYVLCFLLFPVADSEVSLKPMFRWCGILRENLSIQVITDQGCQWSSRPDDKDED